MIKYIDLPNLASILIVEQGIKNREQFMRYRKVCGTLIICMVFVIPAEAQDRFEEWMQEREEQYQQFKDERDAKFLEMLEEAWKEVDSDDPDENFEEPKFDEIPEAPERPVTREDKPASNIVEIDLNLTEFAIDDEPMELPEPAFDMPEGALASSIDYYNVPLNYAYFEEQKIEMRGSPNRGEIKRFWTEMSKTDYEPIVNRAAQIKHELSLNDWGHLKSIYEIGKDIYGGPGNDAVLFTWYMLSKSDYRAKIGYSSMDVYLLLPAESNIYNTPFYTINGERYFVIMLDDHQEPPRRINTYEGSYPDADAKLNLTITEKPGIPEIVEEREFSFWFDGENYSFTVPVNRNLIEFYEFYPHTDLDIYFNAHRSQITRNALLENLGEIIDGRDQVEAANVLMRFTQTAFKYKTDDEQFGRQKYMLPEETVYYPYSDCDDRAIMFAFLVDELLDLEVVGVHYSRHLATAVKFDQPPAGDSFMVNGEQFTIADPTYVLADVGKSMPHLEGANPEIISLR